MHLIEDPKTGVSHAAVVGDERDEVAKELVATNGFYSLDDILEMRRSAESVADRMRVIYHASLAAPDSYEDRIFRLFERYLEAEEPDVRGATVLATSYVRWPERVPLLERRAAEDPDETVREDARIVLDNVRKYPPRSLLLDEPSEPG